MKKTIVIEWIKLLCAMLLLLVLAVLIIAEPLLKLAAYIKYLIQ